MKICAIRSDWNVDEYTRKNNTYGGVGYYRMIKPAQYLKKLGYEIDIYGSNLVTDGLGLEDGKRYPNEDLIKAYIDFFRDYDVIWTKQLDNEPTLKIMFFVLDYLNKPVIMDIDDDYFSVSEDQPAFEMDYKKGDRKRAVLYSALCNSTALFVSTEPLRDNLQKLFKDVSNFQHDISVLPNFCDTNDWNYKDNTNNDGTVVIGWHGSVTHDADLKKHLPEITKVLEKYPNVRLEFMGGIRKHKADEIFKDYKKYINNGQILIRYGTISWLGFPERLMEMKWDIGIAPLEDKKFNESKSNIKWYEYSMKRIPTVASNLDPYKCIKNGVTGFLVDDEWVDVLSKLIEDKKLRKKIGQQAYKEVRDKYQYKKHIEKWVKAFESVI